MLSVAVNHGFIERNELIWVTTVKDLLRPFVEWEIKTALCAASTKENKIRLPRGGEKKGVLNLCFLTTIERISNMQENHWFQLTQLTI